MKKHHVVIVGAGFGGLELSTRLSETMPDAVDVTLIDRNESWYFGYSKLEVMLGRQGREEILLPYESITKDGVRFAQETVIAIDPETRRVMTNLRTYEADYLVICMGADYDMDATPGLAEGGHHYYTIGGAERLRDALTEFTGGRVLVSVLGQPFKCPPAPFEGSFMLHEHFLERGIRDDVQMTTTFPMQRPVPVTGEVAQMFRDGLAACGVTEMPQQRVTHIDPATQTAHLASGETLDYDLFIGIPVHRAPDPLAASGLLGENGFIPVDQTNLRTSFPGVYALGDVCTGPRTVPKAGIFAESAALVVADDIAAEIAGSEPPPPFEAIGICYAEFGGGLVAKVQVNFLREAAAVAERHPPSLAHAAEKVEFGATRRARWFGL